MEPRKVTVEEALSLIDEDEYVHTFRNPNGMLIGADIKRSRIVELINQYSDTLELGGEMCKNMKHGLILNDGGYLFIETNEEKLKELES